MILSPDERFRALLQVKQAYGFQSPELHEALRQEWEIHYGKRRIDDGGLAPLEAIAAQPPRERVVILHRRGVAKAVKGR